jgi:hypothetical protein
VCTNLNVKHLSLPPSDKTRPQQTACIQGVRRQWHCLGCFRGIWCAGAPNKIDLHSEIQVHVTRCRSMCTLRMKQSASP